MKLIVNGKQSESNAATVADVVQSLGYEGDYFAVALNRTCVLRASYNSTPVKDGDEVEILMPMQGG